MKCPYCNHEDTKVSDSRSQDDNNVIRRRRICEKCKTRFTTYERVDKLPIIIIKNNGTREKFDKDKLINGIMKSCNKRQVETQSIEELASDIENVIRVGEREIKSKDLGTMVMDRLKDIDEVAYVRFASVYRQFKDIDNFMEEIKKMVVEKDDNNADQQN